MSNEKNFSDRTHLILPFVIQNGKLDVAATLRDAEVNLREVATKVNATNAVIKDLLDTKVWEKDKGEKGPRRRPTSEIARGLLSFTGNHLYKQSELVEMEERVEMMMSGDPDFIRVSAGPKSGWYFKRRFTSEADRKELAELVATSEVYARKRAAKAAERAAKNSADDTSGSLEEIVDIEVEEDSSAAAQ